MKANNVAIITARGGSKRIPRKNIKDFLGKPIIAYSIEAALKSELFSEVMVSTDDFEIAEIAQKYGAKVPFMRSEKNSDDFASTNDVLLEVLSEYVNKNTYFDWFCCLYPTAPFITSEKLKNAYDLVVNHDADSLIPVVKFSFPPQRAFVVDNKGVLVYKWPENAPKRSQDLEPFYHDSGQFYFHKVKSFFDIDNKNKTVIPYVLSELEVQDIDNLDDWQLAEIKYKMVQQKSV